MGPIYGPLPLNGNGDDGLPPYSNDPPTYQEHVIDVSAMIMGGMDIDEDEGIAGMYPSNQRNEMFDQPGWGFDMDRGNQMTHAPPGSVDNNLPVDDDEELFDGNSNRAEHESAASGQSDANTRMLQDFGDETGDLHLGDGDLGTLEGRALFDGSPMGRNSSPVDGVSVLQIPGEMEEDGEDDLPVVELHP
jgi:hypothetical protein